MMYADNYKHSEITQKFRIAIKFRKETKEL